MTAVVSCLLLAVNGILVATAYDLVYDLSPILEFRRFRQATLFLAPILLLFLEWWLLDRLRTWLSIRRDSQASGS